MNKKQAKNRTIYTDKLIEELSAAAELAYDAQLEMMELAASNYLKLTKHVKEIEISEEKRKELKDQFKKYDNDMLVNAAITQAENVNVVIKNLESCLYEMCRRDDECDEDEL